MLTWSFEYYLNLSRKKSVAL